MAAQASAVTTPNTSSTQLGDQATIAAVYATKHKSSKSADGSRFPHGEDRLSSASGGSSSKYAGPKDLLSFPSTGLRKDDSAAGAAASIGWANQKSFEHWKPDPSPSASRAAILAEGYKTPPLWQPEQSASGAKAAILAAKGRGNVETWKPDASAWGNSAANQAFKSDRTSSLNPQIYGHTALGHEGSRTRKRSYSIPVPKWTVDEPNATTNALSSGATHANNPPKKPRAEYLPGSGASPFVNMPKEMFTSHPPVAPETDEKRRSDVLHASAVAMAKQMYNIQQKELEHASKAQRGLGQNVAISAHDGFKSSSDVDDEGQSMRFTSLQEAAQKLAQERLTKLHDEHAQNQEYRKYYGEDSQPVSRLSIRSRVRHRASSDGMLDEDKEQSQRIRAQMSLFSSSLSQVDEKKRQKDREALMAVAQRNVTASLHGMDERVLKDTGKVEPSMLNEWEVKAHAAAQKNSDNRMVNYRKVNIGGGMFADWETIEEAAAKKVKPVLDEIDAKVEKERVRQAELKLQQEASKRSAEAQKSREKEIKEINRKLKEQDKEEKRLQKEEGKAGKAEQKRVAKQHKRNSKETPATPIVVNMEPKVDAGNPVEPRDALVVEEPTHSLNVLAYEGYVASTDARTPMEMQTNERSDENIKDSEKSPAPPDSSKGVKGWLKTKFSRRQTKTQKSNSKEVGNDICFVRGGALAEVDNTNVEPQRFLVNNNSTGETDTSVEERLGRRARRASSASPVSPLHERIELAQGVTKDGESEEAKDHLESDLTPPPTFVAIKPASPVRDSKFHEEI